MIKKPKTHKQSRKIGSLFKRRNVEPLSPHGMDQKPHQKIIPNQQHEKRKLHYTEVGIFTTNIKTDCEHSGYLKCR